MLSVPIDYIDEIDILDDREESTIPQIKVSQREFVIWSHTESPDTAIPIWV